MVNHKSRIYGKSNYGFGRILKVLIDLLYLKFFKNYRSHSIYFFGIFSFFSFLFSALSSLVKSHVPLKEKDLSRELILKRQESHSLPLRDPRDKRRKLKINKALFNFIICFHFYNNVVLLSFFSLKSFRAIIK